LGGPSGGAGRPIATSILETLAAGFDSGHEGQRTGALFVAGLATALQWHQNLSYAAMTRSVKVKMACSDREFT